MGVDKAANLCYSIAQGGETMNAKQAKRTWERKYNVIANVDHKAGTVRIVALDDLAQHIAFQFVPPCDGCLTTWFMAESGKRVKRPGLLVRKLALVARTTKATRSMRGI